MMQSSRARKLEYLAVAVIVLLAAALRFSNLDSLGYANHYYTAGVKSMLQSWHNFFFVAAEPGGSVTIDKPPVGLWLQAISAYFLGVNGFSVLLPQLLAGTISVAVLYHLVRRSFGPVPGLSAALTLAITPIVVATDRNNTIDSTLILTLLPATLGPSSKQRKPASLLSACCQAVLVGIGFNIKMLQAYLPCPRSTRCTSWLCRKNRTKSGKAGVTTALFNCFFSWA
jgi:4-amino-4-deoxy-L-arabinose transferase-like glycosyltransferase